MKTATMDTARIVSVTWGSDRDGRPVSYQLFKLPGGRFLCVREVDLGGRLDRTGVEAAGLRKAVEAMRGLKDLDRAG